MQIDATVDDFVVWIGEALRSEPVARKDMVEYVPVRTRSTEQEEALPVIRTSRQRIEMAMRELERMEVDEGICICSDCHYELLLRQEMPYPPMRLGIARGNLSIEDRENSLKYELCQPSDALLLYII